MSVDLKYLKECYYRHKCCLPAGVIPSLGLVSHMQSSCRYVYRNNINYELFDAVTDVLDYKEFFLYPVTEDMVVSEKYLMEISDLYSRYTNEPGISVVVSISFDGKTCILKQCDKIDGRVYSYQVLWEFEYIRPIIDCFYVLSCEKILRNEKR